MVDEVQAALHAALKPQGFRKQGRTFNRKTTDDLIQVIGLQVGAHDPPGTVHIPGLQEDLYGWFTVNLGVYVPEVARFHGGGEAKSFVRDFHCCIRTRLGALGPEKADLWWRNSAVAEVVPDLLLRLDRDGIPFLERFASRDAILRECNNADIERVCITPRIVLAIILVQRGNTNEARELLARQAQAPGHPAHSAYVRSLAAQLGVPLDDDTEHHQAQLRRDASSRR